MRPGHVPNTWTPGSSSKPREAHRDRVRSRANRVRLRSRALQFFRRFRMRFDFWCQFCAVCFFAICKRSGPREISDAARGQECHFSLSGIGCGMSTPARKRKIPDEKPEPQPRQQFCDLLHLSCSSAALREEAQDDGVHLVPVRLHCLQGQRDLFVRLYLCVVLFLLVSFSY